MDRSCVITLVKETTTKDAYGVERTSRTSRSILAQVDSRNVFAQVDSVTRTEFFDGGRNGLNPEFMFTMFFGDYEDEPEVIYKGKRYAVYRVYHGRNDTIELYVERKGGTNGNS